MRYINFDGFSSLFWFYTLKKQNKPCVWEPHRGTGMNILLREWPMPTQLLISGTLFAVRYSPLSGRWESWLMSATEYIAIDSTPLRAGVHVDGRSGLARPDQSASHTRARVTTCV